MVSEWPLHMIYVSNYAYSFGSMALVILNKLYSDIYYGFISDMVDFYLCAMGLMNVWEHGQAAHRNSKTHESVLF